MTNVNVHSPKAATTRRLLLALAVGAAILSFVKLGRISDRGPKHPTQGSDIVSPNDVLATPFMLDHDVMALMRELDRPFLQEHNDFFNLRASFLSQPRFDIQEDDAAVTVKVDVPKDVPIEDIQVEIRKGSVLHIQGGHEDSHSQIRFEKTFALGRHMNPDNITATLSKDGELVIKAPKVSNVEKELRKIDVKTEL